jgi:outer membrane receptor protein involved in Fe transport
MAAAQTTSSVQGTVTDEQNAIMAGADVELVNTATNVSKTIRTNAAGRFVFDFVQPGAYRLRVSSPGFKIATVESVVLQANQTLTVNVGLRVGAVTEIVEVRLPVHPINVVDAQVSTTVDEKFIRELPNYARNVLSLATLQPGVEVGTTQIAGGSQNINILGTFANVNGNRGQRNNFYLDGMDSRNYRNEGLQMPNPDAVEEVQVSTSNTSAEFGRQVGGVFNVLPKSGTNSFHGSGFYFFRTKDLNATPSGASTKPDQKQKTLGLTLGGPIIKGKTFFFLSYDHYADETPVVRRLPTAPTKDMLNGDFSALLGGSNPKVIYDPETGQPFPNNVIPSGRFDPVGKNLANQMPTVNNYGDPYSWEGAADKVHNQTFMAKLDHHWSDSNTTSLTLMRSNGGGSFPALDGQYSALPAWGPQENESVQTLIHGRHTWTIKNNLLADLRIGYTKHHANRDNFALDKLYPGATDPMEALGAQNTTNIQEGARLYLPAVRLGSGGWPYSNGLDGHEGWLGIFDQPSFHFGGTVSWTTSEHTVKFGGDAIRTGQRYAVSGGAPEQTTLHFDGRYTSRGNNTGDLAYSTADMLLGRTGGFFQGGVLDYTIHIWNYFFFLQDQWKITPRLTLSAGVRYEIYMPPSVIDDKRTEYYDANPVHGSVSTYRSGIFPNAPAGMAFEGDPGVPKGFYETEYNLLAPRLAIAWDVQGDGKTAVRAGVGKFFGSTALQVLDWPSEQNPWQASAACLGDTIASNPWLACQNPTYTSPPTPFTFSDVQSYRWPSPVSQIYGFDPNYKTAYNWQWNVSVQRELLKPLTLQLGYVGSRGRNLTTIDDINWADYAPGAGWGDMQARRPNQNYANIYMASSRSKSAYDALQAVANLRVGGQLSNVLTYVYQRGRSDCDADATNLATRCHANPKDFQGEWAENVPHHIFKFFFTWDMPLFRNADTLLGKILGGWQISGSGSFYSGTPLDVNSGWNEWNFDGVPGDRPDLVGSIDYPKTTLPDGSVQWVSPSAFARPQSHDAFGNLKRNAVIGPGNWNVDAALLKDFRLSASGSTYLQLRLEAYNLFNHPNLNNPNLNFPDDNFGKSTTKTGHRLVQLGLKLRF